MLMLLQDEPPMPKGKDAVNLAREGFRQVGESVVQSVALSIETVSPIPATCRWRSIASRVSHTRIMR